jgi:hypothetical protein
MLAFLLIEGKQGKDDFLQKSGEKGTGFAVATGQRFVTAEIPAGGGAFLELVLLEQPLEF